MIKVILVVWMMSGQTVQLPNVNMDECQKRRASVERSVRVHSAECVDPADILYIIEGSKKFCKGGVRCHGA